MTSEPSPSSSTGSLESVIGYAESDIGMRREENQDSFGIIETDSFKFFVVADGMGGVRGGATASKLAVSLIEAELQKGGDLSRERIIAALQDANQAILKKASEEPEFNGMGTTFVGLGFTPSKLFIVNVGDSRAYRIRAGTISQLTEDHTLVSELVRSGSITADQAQSHPVSHMLTRSLGPASELEIDCVESAESPVDGDVYLLCSDGLYNSIPPHEIADVSSSFELSEVGPELISMANLRGGADNITAIVIGVGQGYAPAPAEEPAETPEELDPPTAPLETHGDGAAPAAVAPTPETSANDPSVLSDERQPDSAAPQASAAHASSREESSTPGTIERTTANTVMKEYRYPLLIMVLAGTLTVLLTLLLTASETPPLPTVQPSTREVPLVAAPPFLAEDKAPAPSEIPTTANNFGSDADVATSPSSADGHSVSSQALTAVPSDAPPIATIATEDLFVPIPTRSRLEILADRIQILEQKLGSFDQPISGRTAQSLGEASAKVVELQNQRDSVSLEIDRANETLGKWLTVQRTLTDKNQVDLASEVAPFNKEIQETLEQFRRATWNYLQAADAGERAVNSSEHDARLQQLAQDRNDALATLGSKLRVVAEQSAAVSDTQISDLTLKRDELSRTIRELEEEISFNRILVGGDLTAREQARRELESALLSARSELDRLQQVSDPRND